MLDRGDFDSLTANPTSYVAIAEYILLPSLVKFRNAYYFCWWNWFFVIANSIKIDLLETQQETLRKEKYIQTNAE